MTIMSSEDYKEMKQTEAEAKAAEAYYNSQAKRYEHVTDPTAQLGMRAIDALDDKNQAPTNSNDVKIVQAQEKTKRTDIRWTNGRQIFTGGILGGVAAKGIDTLGELGSKALDKDSTVVNNTATDGSSIKGAIGTGNTYTETREEVGGIPLNPGEVQDVGLTTAEPIEEACTDVRALIPVEEGSSQDVNGCFDTNGNGLVCSTGGGCIDD